MERLERVLVIGAGTMGAGIAEVCIKANLETTLCDVSDAIIQKGVDRIETSLKKAVEKGKLTDDAAKRARKLLSISTDRASAASADLIIEAVPEVMDLKKELFKEIAAIAQPEALLATNTSSLSVTEIASAIPTPTRLLGLHFFNPPPIMPLVEVVRAEQTSESSLSFALRFVERVQKQPIVVRDVPGFATSRLGIVLGMEAIRMLENGVASAEDIDRAMELGYKHPMGPLKLTDLVGLDVRLAIAEHLTKELGPQFSPPPLLRLLVRAGKLGKKTGEGFYRWNGDEAVPIRRT